MRLQSRLCLLTICELISTAAMGAPNNAGNWAGEIRCGASLINNLPGYVNPVQMMVASGKATMTRDTAAFSETLSGNVTAAGKTNLTGAGYFKRKAGSWKTEIEGNFSNSVFKGAGVIYNERGYKSRECVVEMTLLAVAQPAMSPLSENALAVPTVQPKSVPKAPSPVAAGSIKSDPVPGPTLQSPADKPAKLQASPSRPVAVPEEQQQAVLAPQKSGTQDLVLKDAIVEPVSDTGLAEARSTCMSGVLTFIDIMSKDITRIEIPGKVSPWGRADLADAIIKAENCVVTGSYTESVRQALQSELRKVVFPSGLHIIEEREAVLAAEKESQRLAGLKRETTNAQAESMAAAGISTKETNFTAHPPPNVLLQWGVLAIVLGMLGLLLIARIQKGHIGGSTQTSSAPLQQRTASITSAIAMILLVVAGAIHFYRSIIPRSQVVTAGHAIDQMNTMRTAARAATKGQPDAFNVLSSTQQAINEDFSKLEKAIERGVHLDTDDASSITYRFKDARKYWSMVGQAAETVMQAKSASVDLKSASAELRSLTPKLRQSTLKLQEFLIKSDAALPEIVAAAGMVESVQEVGMRIYLVEPRSSMHPLFELSTQMEIKDYQVRLQGFLGGGEAKGVKMVSEQEARNNLFEMQKIAARVSELWVVALRQDELLESADKSLATVETVSKRVQQDLANIEMGFARPGTTPHWSSLMLRIIGTVGLVSVGALLVITRFGGVSIPDKDGARARFNTLRHSRKTKYALYVLGGAVVLVSVLHSPNNTPQQTQAAGYPGIAGSAGGSGSKDAVYLYAEGIVSNYLSFPPCQIIARAIMDFATSDNSDYIRMHQIEKLIDKTPDKCIR